VKSGCGAVDSRLRGNDGLREVDQVPGARRVNAVCGALDSRLRGNDGLRVSTQGGAGARRVKAVAGRWIPACAGMTGFGWGHLAGQDAVERFGAHGIRQWRPRSRTPGTGAEGRPGRLPRHNYLPPDGAGQHLSVSRDRPSAESLFFSGEPMSTRRWLPAIVLAVLLTLPTGVELVAQASAGSSANGLVRNMGPVINSAARDAEPTFTADGRTMYFNCFNRAATPGSDICVSTLRDGEWTEPQVVGPPISMPEYMEVEPLLSPDGNQLYIMSNRPGGLGAMDIWVSDRVDGEWTEPRNLGAPINSEYTDHCLYFAGENWDVAYWTSTRPGGFGANDIWMSRRVDGVWQEAVNLGPKVNSAANEHHSLPSPDGTALYVSSDRQGGLGGEDIYVTTRNVDGTWGELVNLGPTVNSEANDRCPALSPDFEIFYFDSTRAGGYGDLDLWWIPYDEVQRFGVAGG
jgi:hypothetical protein